MWYTFQLLKPNNYLNENFINQPKLDANVIMGNLLWSLCLIYSDICADTKLAIRKLHQE